MSLLAAAARGEYFVNLYQNLGNYHLQHIFFVWICISEALVLVSDQTIVSSNAIRTGIGLRFHQN